MAAVSQFFGAYSSRYTAVATPSGTAVTKVTLMMAKVPTIAVRMPARSGNSSDGLEVKKLTVIKGRPSMASLIKQRRQREHAEGRAGHAQHGEQAILPLAEGDQPGHVRHG